MNLSEAAPFEPFSYVFLNPTPPTLSQARLQSQQSRASNSPRRSPTRSPTRSEGSQKRKRDNGSAYSSTTTDFAASTREKTKALLYGQCFHCEMKPGPYSPMDVCHVIPKKSANYARHLVDGLLDFSLDDVVNSILLCKNCHTVFDNLEPGCTFLPTDLEYFIQFEEDDLKRRQAIVDEREQERQQLHHVPPLTPLPPPPRRCPTAAEYLEAWIVKEPNWPSSALGGAYTRFTMPDYQQRPDGMRLQAWHGAPMAAILHAFRAVLGNLTPPEFIAPSIKKQLRKLHELYERRPETGPGGDTSAHLGELPLQNSRRSDSAHAAPYFTLGPNMPSLPPPQPSSSMRDPLAEQVEQQAHDAQQRPPESAHAVSSPILDQTVVPIKASLEHPSRKRRRTSSSSASLARHRRRRSAPPSTPALSRKASTISGHTSPDLQPHPSATNKNGGEAEKETREDPFSYVFRYMWEWGPQSSTQEKVERFLSRLSHEGDTHLL